jgi:colanic acid/amylovoran biosynthesis glycosyltransferase
MSADPRPVVAVFRSTAFNDSETFIQTEAAALRRYRPLVACLKRSGELVPELAGRAIQPWSRAQVAALKVLGQAGAPPAALRAQAPAIVHAHFATDGLLMLPVARALGAPLVTSLRGYDITVYPARMLASGRASWMRYALFARRLAGGGDLFLTVSEALRREAIARGYPEARTVTHYGGVDLRLFEPAGAEAVTPGLVLHVGRLVEKKGTAVLLRAFAEVRRRRPDAQLAIIGEGTLERALRRLAGELGLAAQGPNPPVLFLGAQPPQAVRDWMRRAWVLAAPSHRARNGDAEGLPTVLMEAAAVATPAIATRHSGNPEAVIHGQSGLLVQEGDAEALAAGLEELLGSPDLRARMAGEARSLAVARFDALRQAERLEAHYDRLLAGSHRRAA